MNTETFKAIEFAKKLIIVLEKDLYNFPNKYLELKTRILINVIKRDCLIIQIS